MTRSDATALAASLTQCIDELRDETLTVRNAIAKPADCRKEAPSPLVITVRRGVAPCIPNVSERRIVVMGIVNVLISCYNFCYYHYPP